MEKSHIEKIEYILARSLFQKSSYDEKDIKNNEDEFLYYKNNLLNISEIEINTLFCGTQEDSEFYYHDKWSFADFSFWSRAAYWKIDEAVALSFCRDPIAVNFERLQCFSIKSDSDETPEEYRGGLYLSYKNIMPKIAPFYVQYKDRYRLAKRAVEAEIFTDPVKPAQFIEWLKQLRLPVPERLDAALRENGVHTHDWRAAFERLQRDSEAERAAANEEIAKLKTDLERYRKKELATRERDTLLKLVIGMAVAGYKYDPDSKRNPCIGEIHNDLAEREINLDEDTIRKWLKTAADEHLPRTAAAS